MDIIAYKIHENTTSALYLLTELTISKYYHSHWKYFLNKEESNAMMPRRIFRMFCWAAIFALQGCSILRTSDEVQPGGRHYFGYVLFDPGAAASSNGVSAYSISSIGIRMAQGVTIGYVKERKISLPLDCRLVILVNKNLTSDSERFLPLANGEKLCIQEFE